MSKDDTQSNGGQPPTEAAARIRANLRVRATETPRLAKWIGDNPYVWSRAACAYLEAALESGALPEVVPCVRRGQTVTPRRRGRRGGAGEVAATSLAAPVSPATRSEPLAAMVVPGQASNEPMAAPATLLADHVTSGSETASPPGAAIGPRDAFIPPEQPPSVLVTRPEAGSAQAPTHGSSATEPLQAPEPPAAAALRVEDVAVVPHARQPAEAPLDARAIARQALLKNLNV